MICKCGEPSIGRDLVTYYRKKDGTLSTYVRKEKRCRECFNLSTKKANQKARDRMKVNSELLVAY